MAVAGRHRIGRDDGISRPDVAIMKISEEPNQSEERAISAFSGRNGSPSKSRHEESTGCSESSAS